jgi:hypothetical protein
VKVTTHLQLVRKPRISGSIHTLPHAPWWRSAYLVKHGDSTILPLFFLQVTAILFINEATEKLLSMNTFTIVNSLSFFPQL